MGEGYIVSWSGTKAYVGEKGKVEGVDGEMWPMKKSLHMLEKMLKHRGIKYKKEKCNMCLMGTPQNIGPIDKIDTPPLVEEDTGECKK